MNLTTVAEMDAVIDGLHQLSNAQLQHLFALLCDDPRVLKVLVQTEVKTRARREKFDRDNGYPIRGLEAKE